MTAGNARWDSSSGSIHPYVGKTLSWLVDRQARLLPDKRFLIWEPAQGDAETFTYAAFAELTKRYAAGLARMGIRAGDFVTIHLDNCSEFVLAWYACSRLGAVAVTTNTRSTAEELAYFVAHSGSRCVITQPKYAALVAEAAPQAAAIACIASDAGVPSAAPRPDGMIPFENLLGDAAACPEAKPDALAANMIMYTSGTTSRPKGVVLTHANALWAAQIGAAHARLTEADVHLFYFPLFHANALSLSLLATLWSGGTAVLLPKFSASRFWSIARRYQCTWASMVGFTLRALEAQPNPQDHSFRFWICGGDLPLCRDRWGIKTIGWYGMSETVTTCTVSDFLETGPVGTMGTPAPEYEVAIRRDDGAPAALGEVGNLWVRGIPGVSLFKEYLNNSEATAAAFDDQGWFETGDQAVAIEDGNLFFAGRAKDMLRVGAENVAAVEIEAVIRRVPGIVEVAVVGKPDHMLDEVPVAFVVAQDQRASMADEIRAECEQALSDFERPRDIIFTDALPKRLLDKVLKTELRERAKALALEAVQ